MSVHQKMQPIIAIALVVATQSLSGAQRATDEAGRLLSIVHVARGGAARLAMVRSLRLRTGNQVTTLVLPDAYRIDTQTARGTMTVGFDGRKIWHDWPADMPSPGGEGRGDAPAVAAREAARSNLTRFHLTYLSRPSGSLTMKAGGHRTFGPVSGPTLAFGRGAEAAWWMVVGDQGLPTALVWRVRESLGSSDYGYAMSALSAYREIEKIKFPMTVQYLRINAAGQVTQELMSQTMDAIEVNPDIPKDFTNKR